MELGAVVDLAGRIGDPNGVSARGQVLEREGVLGTRLASCGSISVGTASSTTRHRVFVGSLTGKVGNHLQVVGVGAGHEGDGDGPRGATPLKSKRRVLRDLVVGVEQNGLRERGGREGDNGSKRELHCELNRDECSV